MIGYVRRSLTLKILLVTSLVMIVTFGGTIWYASSQSQDALMDVHRHNNKHFGEFVYRTLRQAMISGDPEQLQIILEESYGTEGLDYVRIADPQGNIAYSGARSEIGSSVVDAETKKMLERARRGEADLQLYAPGHVITAVALVSEADCSGCHTQGEYLGAILVGHDTQEVEARLELIRINGYWFFGGAVVTVVFLLMILLRVLILRPMFRVEQGAKVMATGDLSHPFAYTGSDEVGKLAGHIRTMQAFLSEAVQEASEVTESIANAVQELDSSSGDLVSVSMEQSSGAAEQAAAVHEVTSTAQQIAATSSQISANVENIRTVAEETFGACEHGRDAVVNAIDGMDVVKDKVHAIADATVELGQKSHKIGTIISIIDEISEQTHLVALNAAIEAAGAGEHGKRFSVVAAEVRRLAERTVEATAEIKGLIEEIQHSTNETVMITERGASIVLEGATKVELIGNSLEVLLDLVGRTRESTKEMSVATQQQALAGEQLVTTISDINSVAVQVSRAAEQVETNVMRLKNIARTLKDLSEKNRGQTRFTV